MGIKISTLNVLKRAKYFVASLALIATSAPFVITSGNASAAAKPEYGCVNNATALGLRYAFISLNRTASICSSFDNRDWYGGVDTLNVYGNSYLDLYNYTLTSNIRTRTGGSLTITGDGTLEGTLSGNITIYSGRFSSNPSNYVADGYEAYRDGNYWIVAEETEVTATDASIRVDESADIATITPEAYNRASFSVTDATGADASDKVQIAARREAGKLIISATGVATGLYNVRVTASDGKYATSSIIVYDYEEIDDQVMFVGNELDVASVFEVEGIEWELTGSSDESVATVDGSVITAVGAGTATITVTVDDGFGTKLTFGVTVYDFDEDPQTLIVEKGGNITIRPDSKSTDVALDEEYEAGVVEITKDETGAFSAKGLNVGTTVLTFTLTIGDEVYEKEVTVYVYEVKTKEVWAEISGNAEVEIELPENAEIDVTGESADARTAGFEGDMYTIIGYRAGDTKINYTLTTANGESTSEVLVHVYEAEIEEEIYLPAGTPVNVNDAAVSSIKNAESVGVTLSRGGEGVTTLEGDNASNGVITAGDTAGDDELIFYYGGDINNRVGSIKIHVFELPEIEDRLLSATGRGAEDSETINLNDKNIPEYTMTSSDESVVSIDGHKIIAEYAGDAYVTVKFTGAYGKPEVTFNVTVSDFYSDANTRYEITEGDEVSFTVGEAYDQDFVTCLIDGTVCEDSEDFTITKDENGQYSVIANEGISGGDYTLTFIDGLIDYDNRVDVTLRVRAIEVSKSEIYIKKGETETFSVRASGGTIFDFDSITARVVDADGGTINDVRLNCPDLLGTGICTVRANKAGQYTVEVRNRNRITGREYATKYVMVYVMDFTVEDTEYHVKKGDTAKHLVTALNDYWNETYAEGVTGIDVWQKPGSDSDYMFMLDEDVEAGDYDLTFYAYGAPDKSMIDEKTVTVHVYEMIAPEETNYYGEVLDTFNVVFGDKNSHATQSHAWDEGSALGLPIFGDTAIALWPGKYVVTYTDYMGNDEIVGKYTATFEIYNLSTTAQGDTTLAPGEKFEYSINANRTYGDIHTTVTRDGEVIAEGDGTDALDIDTSKEGKYEISIVNTSAKEHGFDEEDNYYFYVINAEDQTLFVPLGETVELKSDSIWTPEFAHEQISGRDTDADEDGVVTIDTNEYELGTNIFEMAHTFETGERETVKTVTLIIYKINPDEATDPEAVTEETIKNLIDMMNNVVTDEDWEALIEKARKMYGDDIESYILTFMNMRAGNEIDTEVVVTDINDSVSEEDVAAIDKALEGTAVNHIDYYDVSVILSVDGDPFGKLHQLDGSIVVALAKAEDPETGYTRQYFVIAKHGDSEEAVMLVEGVDFYIQDGQIYVISDKFSTFAVAYKDTLTPKAPDTGNFTVKTGAADNTSASVVAMVAVAIAAVITLAGAVKFSKARK